MHLTNDRHKNNITYIFLLYFYYAPNERCNSFYKPTWKYNDFFVYCCWFWLHILRVFRWLYLFIYFFVIVCCCRICKKKSTEFECNQLWIFANSINSPEQGKYFGLVETMRRQTMQKKKKQKPDTRQIQFFSKAIKCNKILILSASRVDVAINYTDAQIQ